MKKIKTDHPYTIAQLKSLDNELSKISESQIIELGGIKIEGKINYIEIKILHSPFMLDVFLSFVDISVPDYPIFNTYGIAIDGTVDYEVKRNLEFNSLADRVSFFSQLQPVKFSY